VTYSSAHEGVTCEWCRKALDECPTNEHGFPLAGERFDVGNPARADMGHAMYFTSRGRLALCHARRLEVTK
jgi:hypothetical protein